MSFTPAQQKHYRPLVERAWIAHCAQVGIPPNKSPERDQWYRRELLAAVGVYTTKQCDHVKDFDQVMLHFAILSNDEYWIHRLANSDERRMFYLIRFKCAQLSELQGDPVTWEYVRAIYKHMNLPEQMHDCPAELLWKVFQALDTHVRRIDRRGWVKRPDTPAAHHESHLHHPVLSNG